VEVATHTKKINTGNGMLFQIRINNSKYKRISRGRRQEQEQQQQTTTTTTTTTTKKA
jgi:hypothetical protein